MSKNRIKNHWLGMETLERIIHSENIDSKGFEKNYISIDKIIFIQESIFKIKNLLINFQPDINFNIDNFKNELNVLIKYISEVQDDFEMHKEDLEYLIKKLTENLLIKNINKPIIPISVNNILNVDSNIIDKGQDSNVFERFDLTLEEFSENEEKSYKNSSYKTYSNPNIDLMDWRKNALKLICDGFPTKYLNQKNKNLFFEILNKLKSSISIKIDLMENLNGQIFTATINNEISIVDLGYLIEMKKLGLCIKLL